MLDRYQRGDLDADQILEFLGIDPGTTTQVMFEGPAPTFSELLRGVYHSNLKDEIARS